MLKNFKCVYEFAVDRALELMPVRKKHVASANPRPALPRSSASHGGGLGAGPSVPLKKSPSRTLLSKFSFAFKGDAP